MTMKEHISSCPSRANYENSVGIGANLASALPLLLVVVAAVLHATWNLMAKRAAEAGVIFVSTYNAIICVAYAPALWFLLEPKTPVWTWTATGCVVLSALVNLAYTLCLQQGYRAADLSVVYPVARGTGPIFAALGAVILLGEAPSPLGSLGLLAVVVGIVLIATTGRLSGFREPGGQAGILWGIGTGALIAGYSIVDAWGVKTLGISPLLLVWLSNILRLPLLLPVALRNRRRTFSIMQGKWGLAIGVGLLAPLSYTLILTALGMGAPLSIVAPMREMSMMVAALLGMLFLHEKVGVARLAGCAVLILGVIMLGAA
jgi:drug/metabolite transporter (DMT)-like permease